MRTLVKLWKVIRTISTVLFAYILAGYIDVLQWLPALGSHSFEASIALYSVIYDYTVQQVVELFKYYVYSPIEVLFSYNHTAFDKQTKPTVSVTRENPTYIYVRLKLKGRKKFFHKATVVLPNPGYVRMQPLQSKAPVTVTDSGNICIQLDKLFGNLSNAEENNWIFKIALLNDEKDISRLVEIKPEYNNARVLSNLGYTCNSFIIKS